jgi:hypothetical protein
MAENIVNSGQYALLQSPKGKSILPCWTNTQLDLRKGYGHIQPNSGKCQSTRYNASIQPSILSATDMEKTEGSLLAKACLTCPIMTHAITSLQTISLN